MVKRPTSGKPEAELARHPGTSLVQLVDDQLNPVNPGQRERRLSQRGGGRGRQPAPCVRLMHPVADLKPAWADPAHQPGAARDRTIKIDHVVELHAGIPVGFGFRGEGADAFGGQALRPGHPRAQVIVRGLGRRVERVRVGRPDPAQRRWGGVDAFWRARGEGVNRGLQPGARVLVERDKQDLLKVVRSQVKRVHGDPRRLIRREAVDTGGDGRKSDRLRAKRLGHLEAAAVAGSKHLCLAVVTAPPHRPDGVDDVADARRQPERGCRLGVAGPAGRDLPASGGQLRSRGTVDRAVHAAAAAQRAVSRVDDGVHALPGDIAENDSNHDLQATLPCRGAGQS